MIGILRDPAVWIWIRLLFILTIAAWLFTLRLRRAARTPFVYMVRYRVPGQKWMSIWHVHEEYDVALERIHRLSEISKDVEAEIVPLYKRVFP